MTMPDAHWGYGFPIGGVAAFDAEAGGIISAGGVGFDISCGIRCLRTNLDLTALAPRLERLADQLFRAIPAGVGEEGKIKLSPGELDAVMRGGARWAVEPWLWRGGRPGIHRRARLRRRRGPGRGVGSGEKAPARRDGYAGLRQPLPRNPGGGAHLRPAAAAAYGIAEGQVLVAIHCGSRGLGHQVGTDYPGHARQGGRPARHRACPNASSPARRSSRPKASSISAR